MIHVVACADPKSKLPEAVVESAKRIYRLGKDQAVWFIDIDCTNSELLDMIWPDDAEDESPAGVGIVVDLDTYSGYAPQAFWKWVRRPGASEARLKVRSRRGTPEG